MSLCAVKWVLPPIAENLHFVIDLTGASAALNGRDLRGERFAYIFMLLLCAVENSSGRG